ncbi:hypothetical protein VSDG_02196 [Cytospora chrysosperma]|uniref:Uncharacterized protein n=1 Tax=Cytospora chrysosperma TaxID=252740 RepID=A0A423WDS3_CYTCH|nr:hypothetical protein VSDG_02196 [Valsa sordida]
MCIQIYRRCICGHREKNGPPQRCEKAHKASRIQYYVSFAGPKIGGDGYCAKKKEDSFGVPEPCQQCKAEGGIVTRIGGSNPIKRPDANLSGQAYSYGGGLTSRSGGAQGLAPLPPPKAHLSSPYSNERYRRAPPSSHHTQPQQPQQPQGYQDQARRPSKYENPRTPPLPPSRSTKYAPEPDSKVRKQSEQYSKKTLREAEKVSKDRKKKGASGPSDSVDDIRARAIAKAREQKPLPELPTSRQSSSRHRRAAPPAAPHEAAYPDLRHHPAMKSDVQLAAHHEAFTTGTHYDEATRRFQDSMVRRGAASHPNTHSHGSREPPDRNPRRYATTRTEHDRYQQQQRQQQQPYVAPYGGYGLGRFGASPLNYSPPETEISAFNVTQKLPYTYR